MFRKKRQQSAEDSAEGADPGDEISVIADAPAQDYRPGLPPRPDGPFDVTEVDDPAQGRVSLGGIWIPSREGLEVRIEADQTTASVVAVTLVMGEGALQVQPFAAPRSEGIWADVRKELRADITRQGGTSEEVQGPVGIEVRTKVPVRTAEGTNAIQPARFLGVDGPRWFLRGVITGRPASETDTDGDLISLFRDLVVVRGAAAMAPREPVPLTLPPMVSEGGESDGSGLVGEGGEHGDDANHSVDDLQPFDRGPEITEIR